MEFPANLGPVLRQNSELLLNQAIEISLLIREGTSLEEGLTTRSIVGVD